jgi:hypothetical protein
MLKTRENHNLLVVTSLEVTSRVEIFQEVISLEETSSEAYKTLIT